MAAYWSVRNGYAELPPDQIPLRQAAQQRGLLYGSAIRPDLLATDSDYSALLARECSVLVPEGSLKWGALRPSSSQFDYSKGDAILAFAQKNSQRMRGHCLVWHESIPKWLPGYITPSNAKDLLTNHITAVVGHYAGKLDSWDVVNEAVKLEDGRPDGLRKSTWLVNIGPEYLDLAFHTAAAADPQVPLFYNDYGTEQDGDSSKKKRDAILQLLSGFKSRNVPIHGFGFQSHLTARENWEPSPGFDEFVKAIASLGLKIYVTELDVIDGQLPADIATRDRIIADVYKRYLERMLKEPAVKAILCWGITDKYTWLNSWKPRADKLPHRPLPFDDGMKSKPAYDAIVSALQGAANR